MKQLPNGNDRWTIGEDISREVYSLTVPTWFRGFFSPVFVEDEVKELIRKGIAK